jgi:hypothetical protein
LHPLDERSHGVVITGRRYHRHAGHDADGVLNLLFHGRCGDLVVYAPTDEDLGTGEQMETGLRHCTLTPSPGARSERLTCPPRRGPPSSAAYTLTVDGTVARVRRQWSPRGTIELTWNLASEPAG